MKRFVSLLAASALMASPAVAGKGCVLPPSPAPSPSSPSSPTMIPIPAPVVTPAPVPSAAPAPVPSAAPAPAPGPVPMPVPAPTSATPSVAPIVAPTSAPVPVPAPFPAPGSSSFGTCYEPMHSALYPLGGGGDGRRVGEILDRDFQQLRQRFTYIRTYHSQYFGVNAAEYAAKYGLKLYLGLTHFGNQEWNEIEIQAAIDGAAKYPGTVEAIIVGNEDLATAGGDKSIDTILQTIQSIKTRLAQAGVNQVQVGTAQRINAWLDPAHTGDLDRLASACDFIGVNIYPFFTQGFDPAAPVDLLEKQWDQMLARFPSATSKLRLTETGWPSAGGAPAAFPQNAPTLDNQRRFVQAVAQWRPRQSSGPYFWFMAYDRRSDDPFLRSHPNHEQHFGLFTVDNQDKGVF